MSDPDWYRPEDLAPPLDCRVRVLFGGAVFEAARIVHKGHRRTSVVWATMNGNRVVHLQDDPTFWQPLHPTKWESALPTPHQIDIRPASTARPEAEPLTPREREWWRNDCDVRYAPPGSITPRMAEARVMRALWAETSFERADTLATNSPLTWLARMIELVEMAEGKRPTYFNDRFRPTSRDLSDFVNVVEWLRVLNRMTRPYYTVLRMRAANPAYTFQEIGDVIGKSGETARQMYRAAVMLVTTSANGQSIEPKTHAGRRARDLKEGRHTHAAAG